jgi:hypothetical protein
VELSQILKKPVQACIELIKSKYRLERAIKDSLIHKGLITPPSPAERRQAERDGREG